MAATVSDAVSIKSTESKADGSVYMELRVNPDSSFYNYFFCERKVLIAPFL